MKFEVIDYRNRIFITSQISPMVFNGLRLEYALDGSSNYIAWKDRMEAVLEDNGLKDFIDQEVPKLAAANTQVKRTKFLLKINYSKRHGI